VRRRSVWIGEKGQCDDGHVGESVQAGREFVEAYVEFVHYAERLYDDAGAPPGQHAEAEATASRAAHAH
jgi:hypothetical protein